MKLDPKELSQQENYKFLIGSVLPRPIAFVTSQNENGVVNAAPFSFFTVLSTNPPMIGFSCARKKGGIRKDTAKNIADFQQFVVQVVDGQNVDQVNDTAIDFPSQESEPMAVGLSLIPSEIVKVPRIKACKIHMECTLSQILEVGGQGDVPNTDFIIGQVVMFHVQEDLYHEGRIDTIMLDPVGRLAGTAYTKIGETFSLPRLSYEDWKSKRTKS